MRKALIFILTAIMLLMTACSSGGDKIKLTGGYCQVFFANSFLSK